VRQTGALSSQGNNHHADVDTDEESAFTSLSRRPIMTTTIELNEFTQSDWYCWCDTPLFPDNSEPLIAEVLEGKAVLVVCGQGLAIDAEDGHYYFMQRSVRSQKHGRAIADTIDWDVSLSDNGFEQIY